MKGMKNQNEAANLKHRNGCETIFKTFIIAAK
jgi:hypothetical protein